MLIQYKHFSCPEEIKWYNTEQAYYNQLPFTSLTQEQFDEMELNRFEEYSRKEVSPMQNKNLNLNNAMYVMQGKTWLRAELSKLGDLHLTTGGDTANKRIDWDIEKSHSNDAVCITELKPTSVDVFDWEIKPIRRQSKATIPEYRGFKHKDLIKYSPKNKTPIIGYVTALFPKINALNFQSPLKLHTKVRINSCVLLWRFTKIFWLGSSVYI